MHAQNIRLMPYNEVKELLELGIETFGSLNKLSLVLDHRGRSQYYRWYSGECRMGEPCFLKIKAAIKEARRGYLPPVVLRRVSRKRKDAEPND